MPLSKQAKALYEAALRRKGLQPGKAVRQDPRTFVGPIRTVLGAVRSPYYHPEYRTKPDVFQMPADTYWMGRGRLQDLEDELRAARDVGLIESKSPVRQSYRRYYNDGDVPNMPGRPEDMIENYGDPYGYKYMVPHYRKKYDNRMNPYYEFVADRPHLTRMGELELEARADEMVENEYKDYLRKMFEGKIPVQEGYSFEDLYDYLPRDGKTNYYERLPYYYRTDAWPDRREYHKTKERMEKGMREAENIGYQILDYGRNPNAWTIQDIIEGKIK